MDGGGEKNLTARELARLSDWLMMKGMTSREVVDCVHYIANEYPAEQENPVELEKKEIRPPATTET